MVVNNPDRTVSVTEARTKLNRLIAAAQDGHMTHIAVGARVAAHLVPARARILDDQLVWDFLWSALEKQEAAWAARTDSWRDGVLDHAGDVLGRVLGWAWRTDPDLFVRAVTDYAGALALAMERKIDLADIRLGLSRGLCGAAFGDSEIKAALTYAEEHWSDWDLQHAPTDGKASQ
jgi:antitoxin (DNA-binding transcriptional repressor) of toxin-antitoxin stability system